ncbi:MAG: hypothetical protein KDH09_13585, partial [Chrysiogenetes bacterium]|nr:hypothetical protein [Chrysiogenetes bacterium]
MRRASDNRRTWPAALLLWGLLCLTQVGLAHAQDTFGDINGDGKVSVVDVGYAQLFALGRLTPTAEQIDTANVFPMISPTGCGPMGDSACIDFANRD